VLVYLFNYARTPDDPKQGRRNLSGADLTSGTGLPHERLNDAVKVLEDNGYVAAVRYTGTAPFKFGHVGLTDRGRVEAEQIVRKAHERTP
jgi:hypothetical protein